MIEPLGSSQCMTKPAVTLVMHLHRLKTKIEETRQCRHKNIILTVWVYFLITIINCEVGALSMLTENILPFYSDGNNKVAEILR